ncbi:hypothetical protein GGI25_005641 [Coemansia spiralis]|uniref:RING-type domain-containing protein n=2 Tax=Coemansia TaxID=4863 RepID=A0A9W8KVY5_9FUNG|nr:hypothetical protein EDC05_005690 [Coemansia umbellata]KAJ2619417.1 hypothetical protein GGI26_005843 [Coemansia sp. RSA 1358]KAJ2671026.1 hypothetical protein GGI25_005641 [Coemansia spiralis]
MVDGSVNQRHIACLLLSVATWVGYVQARAPLVSLTVSIIGNNTEGELNGSSQVTFDRSDYAYPLPQTGFSTFGFSGELYVPANASCVDDVIENAVRKFEKPMHPSGVAFLPYRTCRSEWSHILHEEALAGRAAGALLYSLKDDAAQAAERAIASPAYLHIPVWVVNAVAGKYLIEVMQQVYKDKPDTKLPVPPTGIEFQRLQDDVKLAVSGIIDDGAKVASPRVFVTISRSAADVATADRNFFLKAMVGVGITGIVCFVIAMVVRYFDCLRFGGRGRRRNHRIWQQNGDTESELGSTTDRHHGPGNWLVGRRGSGRAARIYHHHHHHHHHNNGGDRSSQRKKRVLQQHELDLLPCLIFSKQNLTDTTFEPQPIQAIGLTKLHVSQARNLPQLRTCLSCPQLTRVILPAEESNEVPAAIRLQRIYSIQNSSCDTDAESVHDPDIRDLTQTPEADENAHAAKQAAKSSWDNDASILECAICLEEIHTGDVVRKLPCPHVFHSACIDRWLLCQSSVCPLCKRDTIFESPSPADH